MKYPKQQEEKLIEIIEEIEVEIAEHESDSLNNALESVRTEIEYVGYDHRDSGVMTEENPAGMDIEQIKTDFAKIKRHLQKINKSVDRSMSFQELPPADELETQLRHTSTMFTHLGVIEWANPIIEK
jgi:Zn-dependent M32 family carboxypeptidase